MAPTWQRRGLQCLVLITTSTQVVLTVIVEGELIDSGNLLETQDLFVNRPKHHAHPVASADPLETIGFQTIKHAAPVLKHAAPVPDALVEDSQVETVPQHKAKHTHKPEPASASEEAIGAEISDAADVEAADEDVEAAVQADATEVTKTKVDTLDEDDVSEISEIKERLALQQLLKKTRYGFYQQHQLLKDLTAKKVWTQKGINSYGSLLKKSKPMAGNSVTEKELTKIAKAEKSTVAGAIMNMSEKKEVKKKEPVLEQRVSNKGVLAPMEFAGKAQFGDLSAVGKKQVEKLCRSTISEAIKLKIDVIESMACQPICETITNHMVGFVSAAKEAPLGARVALAAAVGSHGIKKCEELIKTGEIVQHYPKTFEHIMPRKMCALLSKLAVEK